MPFIPPAFFPSERTMSPSSFPVDLVLLSDIVAPVLVSAFFTSFWLGLICLLTFRYYKNFPGDTNGVKATVGAVVTLQIFNTIVMAKTAYFYLVSAFGDPDNLIVPIWEFGASVLMLTLIDYMVQTVYAYRLGLLVGKERYLLRVLVIALPLAALGFGMKVTVIVLSVDAFTELSEYAWIVIVWFSCLAGCDIILTSSQVFHLHYHRSGLARSNKVINTLILYLTTTAVVASVLILIQLALFVVLDGWNYAQTFLTFQTSAIRILCLLANLSSRQALRGDGRLTRQTGTSQGYFTSSEGRSVDLHKANIVDFQATVALERIVHISEPEEHKPPALSILETGEMTSV